ncbi:septation regulator SpoVG [Fusobacterium perfoetens]|uniref:septation regulator SpoVG n=1 Tax=Fusobacterium perfoetens TaxID=852 RepID=UPI0015A14DD7|nr:septation regulator SpoVG [Fusobacterium perfoetens]MCF2625587.1 septation regulator SpoVG [Fusobacterium perfoetens]
MKITDIRLRAVKSENEVKLKAYADVTFDGSFVVHGLKIIDGQKGMFVAMPSRKMPDGEYKDIAHPITPELRKEITDTVIARYTEVMESEGALPEEEAVEE